MEPNKINDRIMEISKKYGTSHISSCITSAKLIDDIYAFKKPDEPFILSNGHSGLSLYVILEKYEGKDADKLFLKHGTHPNRDKKDGIWCSTGSLGQGLPIALGMALSDRMRNVYCLTSDGEWAEGSMWETLRIAGELMVANLIVIVNANGFGAYREIDLDRLEWQIGGFVKENCPRIAMFRTENPVGFEKIEGHYKKA
jgi:transketolase